MIDPFNKSSLDNIPTSWDDKDLGDFTYHKQKTAGVSFVVKLFLFSVGLFVLAGGFLIFTFYSKGSSFSENKISINSAGPISITSGESGEVDITVTNNNPTPISEAYIEINYDSGENAFGNKNMINKRIDIGDLTAGAFSKKSFDITLFGAEGTIKNIKPILYYKVPGSKADFNKSSNELSILIKTSPISLNVKGLKELYKNRVESFSLLVKNNTDNDMKNIIVTVRPPNDFVYSSSSLKLINNNPSWKLDVLPANSEREIIFSGKMTGEVGEVSKFTFLAGVAATTTLAVASTSLSNFDNFNTGIDNVYSKIEKNILITGPYINIYFSSISSGDSATILPGELLNIEFTYKNTLYYPLDNVVFKAKLIGEGIDLNNSQAMSGYIDSKEGVAIWDSSSMPELAKVSSQYEGKFRLQIRTNRSVPRDNTVRIVVYGVGDRNAEDSVSDYQDISLDRSWTLSDN